MQYILRGLYGSPQGAASGSPFVFCNDTLFKYRFNQNLVGRTLSFKFQAFNDSENGLQDISTLPAYTFAVTANGGVKATQDYVNSSASAAASSAVSALRLNLIMQNSVTGVTAVKIGALKLPAGTYGAPIANVGCVTSTHSSTMELRNLSGGAVLATTGAQAGTVTWRTFTAGFTLASATNVEIYMVGSVATAVVNAYGLVV